MVQSQVDLVVTALRPAADANTCAAAKLQATGGAALNSLGCCAKLAQKGTPVDACLTTVATKLDSRFSIAEVKKAPCLTAADAVVVYTAARDFSAALSDVIGLNGFFPTPTLTNTPTPTPTLTTTPTVASGCGPFPACSGACPSGFVCVQLFSHCSCAPF